MSDSANYSLLRGLHLQVMGMQAGLASLDHALREALSGTGKEAATPSNAIPPKVAAVSDELRNLLGKPTLEEQKKAVFMPKTDSPTVSQASGTPSGDTPSVPSD